jgi:hypothetical protein
LLRRWLGLGAAQQPAGAALDAAGCCRAGHRADDTRQPHHAGAGNAAPVEPFVAALGFVPQPVAQSRRHPATQGDVLAARLSPMEPALRGLLAAVWLAGGLVPLLLTPMAQNTHCLPAWA